MHKNKRVNLEGKEMKKQYEMMKQQEIVRNENEVIVRNERENISNLKN